MSTTGGSARRSRASPLCRERLAVCDRSLREQYVLRTWQKAPRLPRTSDEHDWPVLAGNSGLSGCSKHARRAVNVRESRQITSSDYSCSGPGRLSLILGIDQRGAIATGGWMVDVCVAGESERGARPVPYQPRQPLPVIQSQIPTIPCPLQDALLGPRITSLGFNSLGCEAGNKDTRSQRSLSITIDKRIKEPPSRSLNSLSSNDIGPSTHTLSLHIAPP